MTLNPHCNVILTITSTKISLPSKCQKICPSTILKSCQAELSGPGLKRLHDELIEDSRPVKISRSVKIIPLNIENSETLCLPRNIENRSEYKAQPRAAVLPPSHHQLCGPSPSPHHNYINNSPSPHHAYINNHHATPPVPHHNHASPDRGGRARGGRPTNPIPRHKRSSHINAEHRRRSKIQKGFDALKEMIPSLTEEISLKDSKSGMLHKTASHVRDMATDLKKQQDEIQNLKKEIADLNEEIEHFQQRLPATGIAAVDKPSCHIEAMYNHYLTNRTQHNWKFWIFSFIVRPLFESYTKMVTTASPSMFIQGVREWAHEHLSLVNLRPCILSALRQISLQTSILTNPKDLPEEAFRTVCQ